MSKLFASERMKLIKQKDIKPEIIVRRLLHKMGIRFRLHVKGLPGTPLYQHAKTRDCGFRSWMLLA